LSQLSFERVSQTFLNQATSGDALEGAMTRTSHKGKLSLVDLGEKIRLLRRRLDMTLDQVATAAGISKPFLSQVERAHAAPSISSLTEIAKALGVTMQYFLEPASEGLHVQRAHDARFFSFSGSAASYARLSPAFPQRELEVVLMRMPAGQRDAEVITHAAEEYVYVLAGELLISLDEESARLGAGDSVHYKSRTSRSWLNPSTTETVVLWVGTPGLF
jgi:transcriptional regulator with XRE-family HTH domain